MQRQDLHPGSWHQGPAQTLHCSGRAWAWRGQRHSLHLPSGLRSVKAALPQDTARSVAAVTADCSCQVTQTDHTSHSRAQRSSADNPLLTDGITRCLPCRPDFLRGPDQQPQPPSLWPGLCRRPRQPHAARELSHCSGSSRLPSGASWEVPSERAFHANAEAPPSLPGVGWWVTADPQLRAHS